MTTRVYFLTPQSHFTFTPFPRDNCLAIDSAYLDPERTRSRARHVSTHKKKFFNNNGI